MSGFHKRKKKRRKEAEKKQGEALRRKLLELRKKVELLWFFSIIAWRYLCEIVWCNDIDMF